MKFDAIILPALDPLFPIWGRVSKLLFLFSALYGVKPLSMKVEMEDLHNSSASNSSSSNVLTSS